jgi:hypothetical protein
MTLPGYELFHLYYGDLHSHCDIGYGHGAIEEAYHNARLQLDFACVTAHAWWADLPEAEPRLAPTVDYHRRGFRRAAEAWPRLLEAVAAAHEPGRFVSFPGFEWHSMAYGDHHLVYAAADEVVRQAAGILRPADLAGMRRALRGLADQGLPALLIPHHIGYRRGYRGLNWDAFTPEFSPVVEIMSLHGCSESDDAPYPMLHTMGPRDGASTYHFGLRQGHIVGAVGSTDHHSAHPGSYGHGRLAVWAEALTREGIYRALCERRCYALTGDRIALQFSVNAASMGAVLPPAAERQIAVAAVGGAALECVEVLRNGEVIHRSTPPIPRPDYAAGEPVKVCLEVGWGPKGEDAAWEAALAVEGGQLLGVEPRFRGPDVVAPAADHRPAGALTRWTRTANGVSFTTRTWGNPATTTSGAQAVCLELAGSRSTRLAATFNGQAMSVSLGQLLDAALAGYLGGFLTPAYRFQRAVPAAAYTCQFTLTDRERAASLAPGRGSRDWYTVRVRQANGQWAWSSPIWVESEE